MRSCEEMEFISIYLKNKMYVTLKVTIAMLNKNLLESVERGILLLLCEMMGMYYENDEKRSSRSVLRLYNISLTHG